MLPSISDVGGCAVSSSEGNITMEGLEKERGLLINDSYGEGMIEEGSHVSFLLNCPPTTLERAGKAQQLLHHLHDSVAVTKEHNPPNLLWSKYRFGPGWTEETHKKTPKKGAKKVLVVPTAATEEVFFYEKLKVLAVSGFIYKVVQEKADVVSEWEKGLRKLAKERMGERQHVAALVIQKVTRGRGARARTGAMRAHLSVVQAFFRNVAGNRAVVALADRRRQLTSGRASVLKVQRVCRACFVRQRLAVQYHTAQRQHTMQQAATTLCRVGRAHAIRKLVYFTLHQGNAAVKIQCLYRRCVARQRKQHLRMLHALGAVAGYKRKIFLLDMRHLETSERHGLKGESQELFDELLPLFKTRHTHLSRLQLYKSLQQHRLTGLDVTVSQEHVNRCDTLLEELSQRHVLSDEMLQLRWLQRVLPPELERQQQICEYRRMEELEAALISADKKRRLLDLSQQPPQTASVQSVKGVEAVSPAQCAEATEAEEERIFERYSRDEAAAAIQQGYKKYHARRESVREQNMEEGRRFLLDFAATQIQRIFRGYAARGRFAGMLASLVLKRAALIERHQREAAGVLSEWYIGVTFRLFRRREGHAEDVPDAECLHLRRKVHALERKALKTQEAHLRAALRNDHEHSLCDSSSPICAALLALAGGPPPAEGGEGVPEDAAGVGVGEWTAEAGLSTAVMQDAFREEATARAAIGTTERFAWGVVEETFFYSSV